jgi:hypothetical protein
MEAKAVRFANAQAGFPRHCVLMVTQWIAVGGLSMPAALCKWFVPVVVS